MNGIGPLVSAYVHARPHGHSCHGAQAPATPPTDPTASTQDASATTSVTLSDAARAKFALWQARQEGPAAPVTPAPTTAAPAPSASTDPISLAPPTA